MPENKFNKGKTWDGISSTKATVTYNGETKEIATWALHLQTNEHTLRSRLQALRRGEISWDECMADKAGRHQFIMDRRAENRRNELSEKQKLKREEKAKKENIKKNLSISMDKFLYQKPV